MKKLFVFLAGLCLLCMSAVNVNAAVGNKTTYTGIYVTCSDTHALLQQDIKAKLVGKWVINVPDAPDEFQYFNAEFKLKEGSIVMDFKGGDMEIKEQKFTEKDGKLSANIYVGEYVKIVIWEEEGVMKGTADTSMGTLPISLKKVEEKKE